jgi:riboflavin biosynthesis pyrimidine reductase
MAGILSLVRRLFPHPAPGESAEISVRDAYDVPRQRWPERPWLTVCMIQSLDGSIVIGGTSGGLGNPTDQEVLVTMRSVADVLLVGAQTVRAEGYGVPSNPRLRVGVVSRSGSGLDFATPLFESGRAFLVVPEDAPEVPVPSVRAGRGEVDLASALAAIEADVIQCEGGASLNGALLAADLIDEITMTLSPMLVGGDGPRITARAPEVTRRMQLAHVMEDDGYLFTRYVRA